MTEPEDDVEVTGYRGMEFAVCGNCGCTGPEGNSPEEAAQLWNTRTAAEAASAATVAELVALLHGVGGLLEANVRTKTRDDHAEQKMSVLIRETLALKRGMELAKPKLTREGGS